jgi:phosphatidate cytidylyltransferase
LGAIIWTVGFTFFFTGHVAGFKWLICPAERLTWEIHSPIDCEPHAIFKPMVDLPDFWPAELLGPVRPVQIHMAAPALFASVVGPFGGFIASGIKRAYDIKGAGRGRQRDALAFIFASPLNISFRVSTTLDFAAFIPGHGGIMDRMDCQMLTSLFVAVYMQTFVRDL